MYYFLLNFRIRRLKKRNRERNKGIEQVINEEMELVER